MSKKINYPLYEVQPFSSVKEMIELAVRDAGDKKAYKFKIDDDVHEITFSEFYETLKKLGAFLHEISLPVGDLVHRQSKAVNRRRNQCDNIGGSSFFFNRKHQKSLVYINYG